MNFTQQKALSDLQDLAGELSGGPKLSASDTILLSKALQAVFDLVDRRGSARARYIPKALTMLANKHSKIGPCPSIKTAAESQIAKDRSSSSEFRRQKQENETAKKSAFALLWEKIRKRR